MKRIALAAAFFAAAVLPAVAQQEVSAKAGEEVRAGWLGSVGENCTPNPAPQVKPTTLPSHGQIRLTQGQVRTNSIPNCPGIQIPAIVIFYKARPDFTGTDTFTLSAQGKTDSSETTYTVQVE